MQSIEPGSISIEATQPFFHLHHTGARVALQHGNGGLKEVSSEDAHTGQYSVKFSGMTGNDWAYVNLQSPYIAVIPGQAYTISGWYKCDPGRNARINWYDKSNGTGNTKEQAGTGQWELIEHTVAAPANCSQLQVWLYGQWGSPESNIYYDDVRIYPQDALMNTGAYDRGTLQLTSQTDMNGLTTKFEYDQFGRLEKTINPLGDVAELIDYYYSRDGNNDVYNPADPNSITATAYQSSGSGSPVISRNFFDGLGRQIQTQLKESSSSYVVSATDYDAQGRVVKEWKPYSANTGFNYDGAYATAADNYYDGNPGPDAGGYPYITTQYLNEPLNRVEWVKPEGAVFQNDHYVTYSYDVNTAGEVAGYNAAKLFKNGMNDENGNITETFSDILGNQILARQYHGATQFDTRFEYDIQGNLLKTIDPSGKTTEYEYNTLNQLTAKITPDLDGNGDGDPLNETLNDPDIRIIYDRNWNVRFSRNPNLKLANRVYFYQYDAQNRPVKEGVGDLGSLTWSGLASDPETIRSFENTAQTYTVYNYDEPGAAYPGARHLRGNVAYVEFKPDVDHQAQFTYYSYNELGLAEWVVYDYEGIADKKITYEYNLTGATTKMAYEDLGVSERFYLWYDYNDLAQLSAVYHSTTGSKPALKSVEYTYLPTGAVKLKNLSEQSAGQFAEATDYFYTPRDWLRGINVENDVFEIDPNNPTDGFAMLLNYYDGSGTPRYNGDITTASYFTNRSSGSSAAPQGSRFHRYIFSYDDLSRLTGGEYRYSDSNSSWNSNTANAFDLGSVSFDAVGNITGLTRKDESGSGAAFNYNYKNNNTNQLDWVENLRNQAGGNYNYDGDGNLIQDVSKDLVNITYDYRDLPTRIDFNIPASLTLDIPDPISGVRIYKALQTITAQNNFVIASDGDVTFRSGERIELKPGFHAENGSQFHAYIDENIANDPWYTLSYTYNQSGERIAKNTSDNITLHYIRGSDGQTIVVLDDNDSPLFYNIAGLGKLVPGGNDVSYYYLTDHLGSVRVIIQDDGTVAGYTDYYPFGMMMPGRVMSSLSEDFYKYNAKQLDDEYGLNWHDYGWRPYDAEIGRFPKIDRFSEKYPSLSPYQYAANSPVNFIDVNGDSIWITYQDAEGNEQRLLYTQGMTYEGNNELLTTLIGSLNKLNSIQSGNTVLTSLTGSTANYNLGVSGQYGGGYNPNAVEQGSGGNLGVADPTNVSGLSHELFHGYQHENTDMVNSTAFEVGAHLFSAHIGYQINGFVYMGPEGGSQEFTNVYNNLLFNDTFSQEDFNTATRTFLQSSFNPSGNGLNYNRLRPRIINNPVIRQFYPLIRF